MSIIDYLKQPSEKFGLAKSIKNKIDNIFDIDLDEYSLDRVINGEGNEKEKIDSVYSSSMQSLVIFNQVNKGKKLTLTLSDNKKHTFTKALFEYKNKVIGYPSSVDVVLLSEDNKDVLFIESKFYEIVRDSVKKNNTDKKSFNVVGVSYFLNKKNSYYQALNIRKEDKLEDYGFDVPEFFGEKKPTSKAERAIKPIKGNTYVYPYGIKQFLSHIIGIMNIFDPSENADKELKDMNIENIFFVSIYNELPGYNEEDSIEKQNDYKIHYEKIEKLLKGKGYSVKNPNNNKDIVIQLCGIKSYQSLFKDNDYLSEEKIKDFYKIK